MRVMKAALLALTLSSATYASTVLECTGKFDHSETTRVEVKQDANGKQTLTEFLKRKDPLTRLVSEEEKQDCSYRISPIHGIDRSITRKKDKWVLAYSCGEDRPLKCVTTLQTCVSEN